MTPEATRCCAFHPRATACLYRAAEKSRLAELWAAGLFHSQQSLHMGGVQLATCVMLPGAAVTLKPSVHVCTAGWAVLLASNHLHMLQWNVVRSPKTPAYWGLSLNSRPEAAASPHLVHPAVCLARLQHVHGVILQVESDDHLANPYILDAGVGHLLRVVAEPAQHLQYMRVAWSVSVSVSVSESVSVSVSVGVSVGVSVSLSASMSVSVRLSVWQLKALACPS